MTTREHGRARFTEEDAAFMRMAIAEAGLAAAEGNHPYGSVVVRDGQVLGRGHNAELTENDPTAHAELLAIREACRSLGTPTIPDATVYASGEPCPMCAAAARWAGVSRVVIGSFASDSARYWQRRPRATGDPYEQVVGVLREECAALFEP